jgi:dimethylaniline monooxygenase (N-oxide forming)
MPPLAELQAGLWVAKFIAHKYPALAAASIAAKTPAGSSIRAYELDYGLSPRNGYDLFHRKHGVDQESYAFQLALDNGAAPTAWHVLRAHGWRVFFTWAMGPNFVPKFRLVGPWAQPGTMGNIVGGELYSVVKRSGGGVCKFFLFFVPLFFFFLPLFSSSFSFSSFLSHPPLRPYYPFSLATFKGIFSLPQMIELTFFSQQSSLHIHFSRSAFSVS